MKKIIALIMLFALALSLCACVVTTPLPEEQLPTKQEQQETPEQKLSFTVIVIHEDGTEKTFTYETTEKFVGPVLEEAGLIKGNAGPYGMEITHVDGVQAIYNTDKAYWAVYEGEEYALQGIDTTPVVAGGVYKLVYTKA